MDKQVYTIVAVEYLNTALFVHGMRNHPEFKRYFNLVLDNPAACSQRILSGEASIGLVPVASLSKIQPEFILKNYCIGAKGPVKTVKLFANSPVNELDRIYLDAHSLTSAKLVEVLCRRYWKINPEFLPIPDPIDEKDLTDREGKLVIGDKVFDIEHRYLYSYDLAEHWIRYTQTDFVFAVWISQLPLSEEYLAVLNEAFSEGIKQRDQFVQSLVNGEKYSGVDVNTYLTQHISYPFDNRKKAGMELYLKYADLRYPDLKYK